MNWDLFGVFAEHATGWAALAGLGLFWAWESIAPCFVPGAARLRHAARNLAVTGLNAALGAALFAGATAAAALYAERNGIGLLQILPLGLGARVVFGVLLLDFWMYWQHRAYHAAPLLWRFHAMHHSDPAMDVTTAARFHVGEIALSNLLRLGVIVATGAPLAAVIFHEAALVLATQFHHANIGLPAKWDRTVRAAVVSPDMHKVHHSRIRREMNSNYASILSVWDRLFGTYRTRDDRGAVRFGVPGMDGAEFQTVPGLLRTPFLRREPPDRLH